MAAWFFEGRRRQAKLRVVVTQVLLFGTPPAWRVLLIIQKEMLNEKIIVCGIVDRQFCIRWCR
jgi:hypothetical protein